MILLTLGLSSPVLAAEAGSGVIEGRVINGTKDGSSTANQEITMKTYINDTEAGTTTIKTDAKGQFVFNGLSTESDYAYQVMLSFQDADYYSQWLSFNEGETAKSTEIVVYDSTTNDAAVRIAMAHTIIYIEQGTLRVVEFYLFVNETDQTYIGSTETTDGQGKTLEFFLPQEATDFQVRLGLMECCIVSSEDGFTESMPVLPGSKEVAYSYDIKNNSKTYNFSRVVNYPISEFDLLVQGEGTEISGDRLTVGEPMDMGDAWFNHFSGSDFAQGDTLTFQISGLTQNNRGIVSWVFLTLALLSAGFISLYFLRRRNLRPADIKENAEQMRQRLLIELAQLDDDFEGGRIPKESYRRRRDMKKMELAELMRISKKESDHR